MSFFEPPAPPPEQPEHRQPVWIAPPDNELGVEVPFRDVLARTDKVAVVITGLTAYSTGFELRGTVRTREDNFELHEAFVFHRRRPGLDDEVFRFGLEFADGGKVTNLGNPFPAKPDELPERPVLIPRGGGGGERTWQLAWWVWPLPPPGALALVCEWPAQGIPLTRHELDAAEILDAAARVELLW